MIFVTLGTQDKSFYRLLQSVEKLIDTGVIKEDVIVQAGFTRFESSKMKVFDYVPMDDFNRYIEECRLLITHGGVGSILAGCTAKKKVLAVARLKKYDEHENDHQIQIVDDFRRRGYILGCLDVDELPDVYARADQFIPVEYRSNNDRICKLIMDFIGDLP